MTSAKPSSGLAGRLRLLGSLPKPPAACVRKVAAAHLSTAAAAAAAAATAAPSSSGQDDAVYAHSPLFPQDHLAAPIRARGLRVIAPVPDLPAAVRADPALAHSLRCIVTMGSIPAGLPAVLDSLPRLALIASIGSGYEPILPLLPELQRRGIAVTNTPDVNSSCVADHCVAMMLACIRRIPQGDRFVRTGAWADAPHWYSSGFRNNEIPRALADLRVGVLGLGAIGLKVAARARAFEMTVGYCNRRQRSDVDPSY
ncbi:hypothetical protein HK405_006723, partial [Cladochytrium tenue]